MIILKKQWIRDHKNIWATESGVDGRLEGASPAAAEGFCKKKKCPEYIWTVYRVS